MAIVARQHGLRESQLGADTRRIARCLARAQAVHPAILVSSHIGDEQLQGQVGSGEAVGEEGAGRSWLAAALQFQEAVAAGCVPFLSTVSSQKTRCCKTVAGLPSTLPLLPGQRRSWPHREPRGRQR